MTTIGGVEVRTVRGRTYRRVSAGDVPQGRVWECITPGQMAGYEECGDWLRSYDHAAGIDTPPTGYYRREEA